MSEANRKRSKNFTSRETVGLLSLISQKKHIIENKKTDAATNKDKIEAWEEIAKAFNSTCPGEARSADCLKKYWDNKKRIARKLKGDERKEVLLTGGGPPPDKMDPHMDLVMSILDPLTVVGGDGKYGSDGQPLNHQKKDKSADDYFEFEFVNEVSSEINYEYIDETDKAGCSGLTQTPKANWKIYCMSDLQQPKSSSLKRPLEEGEGEKENETNKLSVTPVVVSNNNGPHSRNAVQTNSSSDTNNPPSRNTNVTNQVNNIKKPLNRRRPNSTVLRSLAANELSEKYNILADKKSAVADLTLEKTRKEIRNMEEEHSLKVEIMQLERDIKKEQLASLRRPNF